MANSTKALRDYPARSLEKSLVIAKAIVDKGAGQPMDRLLVADAVGRTPSSSEFKTLLSCSRQYGLTKGTEKAADISITDLASKILKPIDAGDERSGKLQAVLSVDLFGRILKKFDQNKLPDATFFKNFPIIPLTHVSEHPL